MKKGDRLMCKKDIREMRNNGNYGSFWFNIGKYYTISKVGYRYIYIYILDNVGDEFFFDMRSEVWKVSSWKNTNLRLLGEYFYTNQEVRKMKLERLEVI